MNIENLKQALAGEPAFRLRQAKRAIFINLIDSWDQAANLPLPLRKKLNQLCSLEIKAKEFPSSDKQTVKILLELDDGMKIESVLMHHKDGRTTVCLSSQVGCPLGCLFCATGKSGFKRNLTVDEIIEQALFFERYLKYNSPSPPYSLDKLGTSKGGNKITNVVFMGMGEPFLNYENVITAIKILNDKEKFNIGARHISVSTIGITEGIKKLALFPLQINLAVSLHAGSNGLRKEIIPSAKKYPLKKILEAVNGYLAKTNRKVMIEYMLIKDFNDSPEQAEELAELLKYIQPPLFFVNLILYNPTYGFKPSPPEKVTRFKNILAKNSIVVTERYRLGRDIKAACGQLATLT